MNKDIRRGDIYIYVRETRSATQEGSKREARTMRVGMICREEEGNGDEITLLYWPTRGASERAEPRTEVASHTPAATALLFTPQVVTAGETPPGERRIVASRLSIFQTESYEQEAMGTGRTREHQATRRLFGGATQRSPGGFHRSLGFPH